MKLLASLALCLVALPAPAQAQTVPQYVTLPDRPPTVSVAASATATLPNDRMHAWLRAESENASAAVASADVNTRMARVLAKLKALPSIDVASSGYSTDAIVDKGKPTRWRVSQSIKLDSADFAALATEVGRLQDEGLLLSGLGFSLSDAARKAAEDSVTQQAIKSWQQRTQNAAQALGYSAWRVGTVHVQGNEGPRPYMAMRSEMKSMAAPAPVAADAGTTEVTVNVNGEAVLSAH